MKFEFEANLELLPPFAKVWNVVELMFMLN